MAWLLRFRPRRPVFAFKIGGNRGGAHSIRIIRVKAEPSDHRNRTPVGQAGGSLNRRFRRAELGVGSWLQRGYDIPGCMESRNDLHKHQPARSDVTRATGRTISVEVAWRHLGSLSRGRGCRHACIHGGRWSGRVLISDLRAGDLRPCRCRTERSLMTGDIADRCSAVCVATPAASPSRVLPSPRRELRSPSTPANPCKARSSRRWRSRACEASHH